jgi:hypothetical protein
MQVSLKTEKEESPSWLFLANVPQSRNDHCILDYFTAKSL